MKTYPSAQTRGGSKVKKAPLLLFSIALLLAGGVTALRGQSALDGFDPDANDTVRVVVVQPDGRILIGGDFTTLSPNGGGAVVRNFIARLNPDGTLDTAFNPSPNGNVYAIAVQPDGKILIGGGFTQLAPNGGGNVVRNNIARVNPDGTLDTTFAQNLGASDVVYAIAVQRDGLVLAGGAFQAIGGALRNRIARLDATTGLADSTFDPNANGLVLSIAVQADGKILAGGLFNDLGSGAISIGGQVRNRIARLDATTGLADSFDPNANHDVRSIAVQADGKILAGGDFTTVSPNGGAAVTRNRIARLNPDGTADSFDPNASNTVNAIAVQADGKILAGGTFVTIGGQTRPCIARLDATIGAADSFDPNASSVVFSIAVQADGKILAGGFFTTLAPNGGASLVRNHIARLETDGRLDRTLNLSTDGAVLATAGQPDGKILIGGGFTTVLGVARNNIARLNTDGTLDTAFNPNADGPIYSIAMQVGGKILVGGDFTSIGAQSRPRIARLDPATGAADSFNPNAGSSVFGIAVQADGKILACGNFTTIGGATRNYLARLDPTNGTADSWNPNPNSEVLSIAVQADGKVLAGGYFFAVNGGTTRNAIARFDATTGLADSWDPHPNNIVNAIAVQPDGKILVGGNFSSIGGATRSCIARIDATNGTADSWDPHANSAVYSIAVQADGKVLAGGLFSGTSSIGGATRNYIARLDATNGAADSFDPNANNFVASIAVQPDGKIFAGGYFTTIGGQSRFKFARLSNDTAALQNLAVTQINIAWTRGGSIPQFTRVTFESSTDNLNYSFLGNGTVSGGNWTLTGLNLPTGQNLFIRARGYYRGDYQNGSESIAESVRNVFLTLLAATPPLLNIQLSAPTNVVLSWVTNSIGFTLESNTNLTTTVWSVVTPAPAVSGTNNVVTNAVSGSTRFYRLRK